MVRPRPRIAARDRSAARIDSGLALYASLTTVTPDAVVRDLHPPAAARLRSAEQRGSTGQPVIPKCSATAAAAHALAAMCSPTMASCTSASPDGVCRVNPAPGGAVAGSARPRGRRRPGWPRT